jgi:hypothetical protein
LIERQGRVAGSLGEPAILNIRLPHLLFLLGIALLTAGPMLVSYQAIGWFMHGYWTGMPLSVFWSWIGGAYPNVGWHGDLVADWVNWFFNQPLSLVSVVTGAALIWVCRSHI